ncbi:MULTISPECIES: hypothetical protein [unclassified Roseovarius]|uniref:hypothetical protein n=1 Tax=unclassified Roseovarius TaxID=2614913 RepID=UPI00273EA1E9|nr:MULTISPECIES: hypothetical protein [unclassified Roseovarius]
MKTMFILGAPLALAACAKAPELVSADVLAPASSESAQIRHVHGPALLGDFNARPVKGPEDWRKLNDQQSPAKEES